MDFNATQLQKGIKYQIVHRNSGLGIFQFGRNISV